MQSVIAYATTYIKKGRTNEVLYRLCDHLYEKGVDQRSPLSFVRPLILKGADLRSPLSLVRPLILKRGGPT